MNGYEDTECEKYFTPPEKPSTANREAVKKVILNGETLEQTLFRDVHDIANSCNKDDNLDIESWVSHIITTFLIHNDEILAISPPMEALTELEPDVDAQFGQAVCCDILPRYGVTDPKCYQEIIGLAYALADFISQATIEGVK